MTESIQNLLDKISDPETGNRLFAIYYQREFGSHRGMAYGLESHAEQNALPLVDLQKFWKVGELLANDLEDVFYKMQGEVWSPNGEARPFIEAAPIMHTSMSVGDIFCELDAKHKPIQWYMVADFGFLEIAVDEKEAEAEETEAEEMDQTEFYKDDDHRAEEYKRAGYHEKVLREMYYEPGNRRSADALTILDTYKEYIHGTAEVEEMGVSIRQYGKVVEDMILVLCK